MRVFVVNLDCDTDRMAKTAARLHALGVAYERYPAVYGCELSNETKAKSVNRFRWHCAVGQFPTDGEIGCALSHLGLFRKILSDGEPAACILEDDVVLSDDFPDQMARVEQFLLRNEGAVVQLSDRRHLASTEWSISPFRGETGTYAYAIGRIAAQSILQVNYPLRYPIDWWHKFAEKGGVQMFRATPAVCDYDRSWESKTVIGRASRSKMSFGGLLLYKMLRAGGLLIEAFLP